MNTAQRRLLTAVLVFGLIFTVSSCSSGGAATAPTAQNTPQVSLPGDQPSPPAASPSASAPGGSFSTALEFTRLVHIDDHASAGALVADDSPAARYIAFQNALARVEELNGQSSTRDESDVTIDGDEKSGKIEIELTDGDKPLTYTWRDFTFDNAGKITGWTGKSGPIDKALWRKSDSKTTHGVVVKLVSAYVSNAGSLFVVVEVESAKRGIRVMEASYTPTDGYRQKDVAGYYTDLDEQEKALTLFQFDNTKLGGKLRIDLDVIDKKDSSLSSPLDTVTLSVR